MLRYRVEMRPQWNARFVGKIAGNLVNRGRYWQIAIDDDAFYAHRLAWVYVHGVIPEGMVIDHRDHDGTNNRIENLRLATNAQNVAYGQPRSLSGPKGVYRKGGSWVVRTFRAGRAMLYLPYPPQSYIGSFHTLESAKIAYREAVKREWGEFAYTGEEEREACNV